MKSVSYLLTILDKNRNLQSSTLRTKHLGLNESPALFKQGLEEVKSWKVVKLKILQTPVL